MAGEKAIFGLSGNVLKISAALTMLIDHIGIILLPQFEVFRIIGRISFPIFAYMIAEGCYYTRNKLRYFAGIFSLGVVCQVVYSLESKDKYLGILITFSVSIIVVYAMQYMKWAFISKRDAAEKILSFALFASLIVGVYFLNKHLTIDYGFFGCMAPAFASVFKTPRSLVDTKPENPPESADARKFFACFDMNFLKERLPNALSLAVCLIFLAINLPEPHQMLALMAIPFLLLYSGKRGKLKMKYFFYIFYPLHLVLLEGISMLIN